MKQSPRNSIAYALYANAAILLAILLVLMTRSSSPSFLPSAFAQNQPPIAGGAGIFVMPGQFSTNTWGCYLLDVDTQTLCVYQFFPPEKQLKLVAARNFRYDRRLSDFNAGNPSPAEVRDWVEKEQVEVRTTNPDAAPVSPEAQ